MKHPHPHKPQERWYSRREILQFCCGTATALLFGCGRDPSTSSATLNWDPIAGAAELPACVVRPEQTEGPYFIDEKLNRSDIRVEPSDKSITPGVPLRLVSMFLKSPAAPAPARRRHRRCWHCDALGMYSDLRDRSFDTAARNSCAAIK